MFFVVITSLAFLLLLLYLVHVNHGFSQVPEEVPKLSAPEWTDEEIRVTYKRVCKNPIDFAAHLPPALERRYVVVGGSGLVGGFLILHLLARGQPPESIRIVDFRRPLRDDLNKGKAAQVQFTQADIACIDSITAAFQQPWASKFATLPLTVFHVAAAIRPGERAKSLIHRVSRVNVVGTENVLSAAKNVGADILIATSSGSISTRPTNFWIPPWKKMPDHFVQIFKDPDEDQNIRPHEDYFGNYAMTKAQAEDKVLKAHGETFRTGVIRPACTVYGNQQDISIGIPMARKKIETCVAHLVQPLVHAENVSLGHLLYERALAQPPSSVPVSRIGGRAFAITDPNPPPSFGSIYRVLCILAGCTVTHIPAVLIFMLAYAIEAYSLSVLHFPGLARALRLKEPSGYIAILQPSSLMSAGVYQYVSNAQAEKSVEEGGLGYRGVYTTMEGLCTQVRQFMEEGAPRAWDIGGTSLGIPVKS